MEQRNKILDIAMNLSRIGGWAADDFAKKRKRILLFLDQTTDCVDSLETVAFPKPFQKSLEKFLEVYPKLEKAGREGPTDTLSWAETMMTWGNILTHRSRLIPPS